jgi:ABC-type phosphate transport system substrate-binding protein
MTSRRKSFSPSRPLGAGLLVALVSLLVAGARVAADVENPNVVVVVSAKSPITTLSRGELTDMFLGRESHFPDGRHIVPIDQREGSPARSEFNSAYLGRSAAEVKAHWSKAIFTGRGSPPRMVSDSEQLRRLIASDPSTIGYLERSLVDADLKIVRIE